MCLNQTRGLRRMNNDIALCLETRINYGAYQTIQLVRSTFSLMVKFNFQFLKNKYTYMNSSNVRKCSKVSRSCNNMAHLGVLAEDNQRLNLSRHNSKILY